MFGSHDDEDKPAENTSVTSPTTDETPAFDTSSVSLPPSTGVSMTNDTSAPALPADDNVSTPPAHDDDQLLTRGDSDDLIRIKQDALHELSPLVDHLDQSPEEKFRTTMMMIQASDDQSLLQTAYDAAKAIQDDKVRAQALLDVINEINYFTQQSK